MYEWRGERWTLEAKITAVGANPDPTTGRVLFSFYVTLRGDYIFLGVPLDIVDGVMTGSVLAYEHDGTSWVPRARFTPDSNEPHQRFGAGLLATDHGLWVSTEDEIYVYELPQPTNTEATPGTLKQAERSLLRPSYPNPFSTATQIAFELDRPGHVRLSVFDLLGREVEVLAAGLLGSGTHQYHWDAGTRPSGLYLVRLTGDTFAVSQPITLSR
ncbi:MAG: T9SS type A sorting domain-containing protein [Bacteroidota bacterium]